MYEHALLLMIGAIILNIRNDGSVIAGVFLLISLMLGYIQIHAANVELFALYAFAELLFIHSIHYLNTPKTLVADMINLSRLSIAVQLIGVVMWIEFYSSDVYMLMCEFVFAMQLIRLYAHGYATRKVTNIWGGALDNLYTGMVGKKL